MVLFHTSGLLSHIDAPTIKVKKKKKIPSRKNEARKQVFIIKNCLKLIP